MTPEELIEKVVNGDRIRCRTPQQRRAVLEFFAERGFPINPTSRRHMEIPAEQDNDLYYMDPGYSNYQNRICLYCDSVQAIEYADVADIFEGPAAPLDDRSDTDFAEDLALLLR